MTNQAIPHGWRLVPAEMTLDMSIAFAEAWYSKRRVIDDHEMQDAYAAMLAAAPGQPASDTYQLPSPAVSAEPVAWQYYSTIEQCWCPAEPERVEVLQRTHKVRPLYTAPPAADESASVGDEPVGRNNSKHPIPDDLRRRFSHLEDTASDTGAMKMFTDMRTTVQAYFAATPAAVERPPVGDERAAFEKWYARYAEEACREYGGLDITNPKGTADEAWQARAALASAHAADARDALDAARWRFIRRKLCLCGNGDGTCAMHAINLPASIPGWPEPGDAVAEFCDAAIDAAIAAQQSKGGE
ncbi:hypothetical protein [Bordetella avium]|uniref:hypothetical protein n=1 Tax=Bordetella avium TaxID=521 RepID=UPI000689C0FF|nr:hypothetical protein [Bordetella avium]